MEKVYNSGKKGGVAMNYIKRHLNWTLVIGVLIIELPVIYLLTSGMPDNMWWVVIPVIICEMMLETWYLHQKDRSYLFLLLNFIKPFYVPVGFLILLALGNYRNDN